MRKPLFALCALLVFSLSSCGKPAAPASAPEAQAPAAAPVEALATMVNGTVEIQKPGETTWQPLHLKDGVLMGSKLRAGADGEADVLVTEHGAIRLKAGTEATIEENEVVGETTHIQVKVTAGRLLHRFDHLPSNVSYRVTTPNCVAGIRGTEFDITTDPDGTTRVRVLNGRVAVDGQAGGVSVGEKEGTVVSSAAAPAAPQQLTQKDVDSLMECSLLNFVVALQKAHKVASLAEMRNISVPLEVYASQHDGNYPPTLRDAGIDDMLDDWKQPYRYEVLDGGKGFVITSSGPDKTFGTDDDLEYRR